MKQRTTLRALGPQTARRSSFGVRALLLAAFCVSSPTIAAQLPTYLEELSTPPGGPYLGYDLCFVGEHLFVGSIRDPLPHGGQVYHYNLEGVTDVLPTGVPLDAPNLYGGSEFGTALAANEEFLFASAPRGNAGEVRVFERQGSQWLHSARLAPSDNPTGAFFGSSCDVDGNLLAVGAPEDDSNGLNAGSVYVFQFNGTDWLETQKLVATDTSQAVRFGFSVAVRGNIVAVGSRHGYGAVYLFERLPSGQYSELKLSAPPFAAFFGTRVEFSESRLYVGAPHDSELVSGGGAIYVYEQITGAWNRVEKIQPAIPTFGYRFGEWFAVRGNRIVHHGLRPPLFSWTGFTGDYVLHVMEKRQGSWTPVSLLDRSSPVNASHFGQGIAISDDWVAGGAIGHQDTGRPGTVYFYPSEERRSIYCFGVVPQGAGCTPCPCGNYAPPNSLGGCINSRGESARLKLSGVGSVTDDTLGFRLEGAASNSFAYLLSGSVALPVVGPCPAGTGVTGVLIDGLRCIGGNIARHSVRGTDNLGRTVAPFAAPGQVSGGFLDQYAWTAGQTRHFQAYYRDFPLLGCETGINTTNASVVTIRP